MTACNYCGTRIMNVYEIGGSDGSRFEVGSDCVRKTGDVSLVDDVKKNEAVMRGVRAEAKRRAAREAAEAVLAARRAEIAEERRIAELDRALAADAAARAEEARKANLCYLGKPGWMLKLDLRVEKIMMIDGKYGRSWLHVMRDSIGNRVVWFAEALEDCFAEGETYQLEGRVKAHSEFKGEKQTVLGWVGQR